LICELTATVAAHKKWFSMNGKESNPRISALIIDDNPDDRVLVKRQLEQDFRLLHTFEVIDMPALYTALERGQFDVAVTDYELKWSNGLFVSRAIKARYPDCPVVMFTNSGDEEVAVSALKQGVDDYVLKRKGYKPLGRTVQKVLEWSDTKAGRKPRCLVMAGNAIERERLHELISRNYKDTYIITFTSGQEVIHALSHAQEYLHDALITEGVDGAALDIVRKAVAMCPSLPVVSVVDSSFATAYYQAGAWGVIQKPIVEDVFVAWLQRAIHISSLGRRVARQNVALERYARNWEQNVYTSSKPE
jgi:CheY-like chemotaxis protein